MKEIRKLLYYIISVFAAVAVFAVVYNYLLSSFSTTGTEKHLALSGVIKQSRDFVDFISMYSGQYLESFDQDKETEQYGLIEYDDGSDSYLFSNGTFGSLSGQGPIPESGLHKTEINMTISYCDFFSNFYSKIPGISWIYYTSENNYIYMYPQTPKKFIYTDELKSIAFYTVAIPENNPLRIAKWTPVYLDAAGKGLMVTLSSPVYAQDDFLGVISLDLTTETLQEYLSSSYNSYLVDKESSVVTTGQDIDFSDGVEKLSDLGIPESAAKEIYSIENDTIKRIGTNYYYIYNFSTAPWTLVLTVSVFSIAGKAFLLSLPVLIIGILLFAAIKEAENRKKAEETARKMAISDQLTGLNNRFYLDAIIETEIQHANRYNEHLSVVSFDLDYFKKINDTWGHDIGDEVLKTTAMIAKNAIRAADSIIRMGGEEFLILLPETDSRGAYFVAEKIRKALEATAHPAAGVCTASFGIAEMIRGETYSNLYRRADEALYMAKESGRNRVFSFEAIEELPANSVIIKWSENWNSGNATIDEQHRKLVEIINETMSMILYSAEFGNMESKLDYLIQHICDHFVYEEQVMAEIGYPQLYEHREIHMALIDKFNIFKEAYNRGEIKTTVFSLFVVKDILHEHIVEYDAPYFPFLFERAKTAE